MIDDEVINVISELSSLAPLHNPAAIIGINAFKEIIPSAKAVAVFDTSFHQTMEKETYLYALPYSWYTDYKVRKYEKADKFAVGDKGNKSQKFVEAAKGTNLFFAVYKSEESRSFASVPLNKVIYNLKQGYSPVPEISSAGEPLLFWLSPNDLVYLPTAEDLERGIVSLPLDRERIYKMVSCTGNECHFIPALVAYPILQVSELGSNNKSQRAWTGEMIKETCIPLKVDRLGNIVNFNPRIL